MDNCEPWYQTASMSHEEAKQHLFTSLKHEFSDHVKLTEYINQTVGSVKDLGSIRGYWTFLHAGFKKEIGEKFKYYDVKKTSKLK
tara:strand:- start:270 stop:524 length:255 start_codon:yes stop_codon:yes gene_type:complete